MEETNVETTTALFMKSGIYSSFLIKRKPLIMSMHEVEWGFNAKITQSFEV